MFSAGAGSFRAAVVDRASYPKEPLRLVFCDTLYEDADAYRFLIEGAAHVFGRRLNWTVRAEDFPDYQVSKDTPIEEYRGNPEWRAFLADLRSRAAVALPELIWLVDGRDPWEVFRDRRYLGNTRADPCSQVLKRKVLDDWREGICDKDSDVFAVGIDEHERHRFEGGKGKRGIQSRMAELGWRYHAPLLSNFDFMPSIRFAPLSSLTEWGMAPAAPRLYQKGYMHNNCGGFCVKAGLAHWQNRWRIDPERYRYDAMMERKIRDFIGGSSAITILRDRRGGVTTPVSLDKFAERLAGEQAPVYEYEPGTSGCGCMTDV